MDYYSAKKMKQCHLHQHGWPRDYYTKCSKSERERQISYDITYVWKIKNYPNKLI